MPKFLVDGAELSCPMGTSSSNLSVPDSKICGCSKPMANMMDAAGGTNIPPFGTCKITKMPCMPVTCCWITSSKVNVRGLPAANEKCMTICPLGGVIKAKPGQSKVDGNS